MNLKIVVIGGVAAGTCAAVKARRTSEDAEIVLYEKYKYVSYSTCGLPYFVSGKITDVNSLIINTSSLLEKRFNLKIKTLNEVTKIDPKNKTITINNLRNGNEYKDSYDKLIIATGSKPFSTNFELINAGNVFFLRTIDDGIKLKSKINLLSMQVDAEGKSQRNFKEKKVPSAVIIGGGYIGLELVDAFLQKGFSITIIEKTNQLLPMFDFEITEYLENYLILNRIKILKRQEVIGFERDKDENITSVRTSDGNRIPSDIIFVGTGIRPEVNLAIQCGINIGYSGAISVNEYMQTSIEDIYAAGDCCECKDFISKRRQSYFLAGIASIQGRIAGYNAACGNDKFSESIPTSIVKVLDVYISKTGISLKMAREIGINAAKIELHAFSHGSYYPGAQMIHMIVIYNRDDGTVIGFEAIGKEAVDKKTDVLSVVIKSRLKVWDLTFLNFCYHPETGTAKDSINVVGMIGENIKKGEYNYIDIEELRKKLDKKEDVLAIDVRTKKEFNADHIEGAINIPLDELRETLEVIDRNKTVVVYCKSGYRSYIAYRVLKNNGFENVFNLNGSYLSWIRKL